MTQYGNCSCHNVCQIIIITAITHTWIKEEALFICRIANSFSSDILYLAWLQVLQASFHTSVAFNLQRHWHCVGYFSLSSSSSCASPFYPQRLIGTDSTVIFCCTVTSRVSSSIWWDWKRFHWEFSAMPPSAILRIKEKKVHHGPDSIQQL